MGASTSWSRRSVIALAAAGVGTVALGGPLASAAAGVATTPTAPHGAAGAPGLRREHWTGLVGRRVAVDGPSGRVRARVAGVEDLRSASVGDPGAFAVELRTDRGQGDIAGLTPVTIPGRGVATLLVTAVDRGSRHRSFEIVVNNPAS